MIATLNGEVVKKNISDVILEVQGVGYKLNISAQEFEDLTLNQKCRLFVHESIREDAYDLYGFVGEDSLRLFELLIGVKNIGPKAALAILSIGSVEAISQAIASGDVATLTSAKGVGKKAAEQVIVELRDRVGLVAGEGAEEVVRRGAINLSDEALQGLVSLGYSEQDAASLLKSVDPKLPVSERLKRALQAVNKNQT